MTRLPHLVAAGLLGASLLVAANPASALTDLIGGKSLVAREHPVPKKDLLKFTYKDPALNAPANPTCGASNASSLQIVTSEGPKGLVSLPCANWKQAGSGFKYKSALGGPGGIRTITLKPGILKAKIQSSPYSADPVTGPIDWIETRLSVGTTTYCGRWETPPSTFKRNLVNNIKIKGPTAPCEEICGNDLVEAGEDCDDGNLIDGDGCDSNCTVTACGNGVQTAGEECDDGNIANGDGCRSNCTIEECGDGVLDAGESCDDGNTASGDCCSASCGFEPNGSVCANDGNPCTNDVCNGAGTCTHPANNASCNDGNDCTVNDSCLAGSCSGEYLKPWVNEFDYDDNAGFPNDDRDEFVEIAGPEGLDISGYQIVSVEGAGGACGTPFFINAGDAHFVATIPNGTVLGDDTGTGVGLFVVCFTNTSTHVSGCDVTLPGAAADSNLKNGNLTNADNFSCPDGILVLDDQGGYVDAVSYEGLVANTGTYGGFFHINPPYSAERDEGWLERVSIYKNSSTLQRATSGVEWTDPSELGNALTCQGQTGFTCPTNTATPGTLNPGQAMACGGGGYGSAYLAFLDPPESLFE